MLPDHSRLIDAIGLKIPLIGFYDAPDPKPFAPLIEPPAAVRTCIYAFYHKWLAGVTLCLTKENYGCGGAGNWLCGVKTRTREQYIDLLADREGLKATREVTGQWIDHQKSYRQEHEYILIGPLRRDNAEYLHNITFFANPDQLSLLLTGAQYHRAPGDLAPAIVPFGAGCMELITLFEDLDRPQAVIGATDIAMRQYLPPDAMAFTANRPLFDELCALDEKSFL